MSIITGGKIFYSQSKEILQAVERGIEYANDGALDSLGVMDSNKSGYAFMLPVRDRDEDEVSEETI